MRGLRGTCFRAVLGAVLAIVAAAPAVRAQAVFWRGRSAGFDITWNARDISARRVADGRTVFSARAITDREWAEMYGEGDDDVQVREYERNYRLLSVVGSVVSLEERTYCDCGGVHPISWTRFVAYDVARSTVTRPHAVSATDVVPEAALLRALAADRLIRQAMDKVHARSFASLAALTSALKFQEIEPPGECTFQVGEEFPTEFAFHHLANGQVAVRFSLSHSVEVCRGMMVQVGVLVPPLPRWTAAFEAANARRAGFLMKDAPTNPQTILNYKPR